MNIRGLITAWLLVFVIAGCGAKEDPKSIHTITLNNQQIQRTFYIPGEYTQTQSVGGRTKDSIWINFVYPSMKPFYQGETPAENSVALLIVLSPKANRKTRSEMQLDSINSTLNHPPNQRPARYLGISDGYDVYDEEDKSHLITRTYFIRNQDGTLSSFTDPNFRKITGSRQYADVLELRYLFPRSLQSQKMQIDQAVTKLVDSLMKKP